MRIFNTVLIFFIYVHFSFANSMPTKISVLQARGLEEGKCYTEVAALSCDETCVLDFFPTTQAQISLAVEKISKADRKKFGRIFEVKFQYSKNNAAIIHNLSTLNHIQIQDKLNSSSGLFRKVECKMGRRTKL